MGRRGGQGLRALFDGDEVTTEGRWSQPSMRSCSADRSRHLRSGSLPPAPRRRAGRNARRRPDRGTPTPHWSTRSARPAARASLASVSSMSAGRPMPMRAGAPCPFVAQRRAAAGARTASSNGPPTSPRPAPSSTRSEPERAHRRRRPGGLRLGGLAVAAAGFTRAYVHQVGPDQPGHRLFDEVGPRRCSLLRPDGPSRRSWLCGPARAATVQVSRHVGAVATAETDGDASDSARSP